MVTIPELAGGKYNSQLIMLENVEFSAADTAKTWSDPHGLTTQNRSLMDCDNNVVVVRTSGYANFAGVSLPNGNGTFVAIASILIIQYNFMSGIMAKLTLLASVAPAVVAAEAAKVPELSPTRGM